MGGAIYCGFSKGSQLYNETVSYARILAHTIGGTGRWIMRPAENNKRGEPRYKHDSPTFQSYYSGAFMLSTMLIFRNLRRRTKLTNAEKTSVNAAEYT